MGKMKRIFIPILMFAFLIANITFLEPTSVYAKKNEETSQEQSSNSLANLIKLKLGHLIAYLDCAYSKIDFNT